MKKLEAWQTKDGRLFTTAEAAAEHETQKRIQEKLGRWAGKWWKDSREIDPKLSADEVNRLFTAISEGRNELMEIFKECEPPEFARWLDTYCYNHFACYFCALTASEDVSGATVKQLVGAVEEYFWKMKRKPYTQCPTCTSIERGDEGKNDEV